MKAFGYCKQTQRLSSVQNWNEYSWKSKDKHFKLLSKKNTELKLKIIFPLR